MSDDMLICVVISVVFTVMALLLIMGKLDTIIKLAHKELYNMVRVRWCNAAMLFLFAISFPVMEYLGVTERLRATIILVILGVFLLLTYTWARRRE